MVMSFLRKSGVGRVVERSPGRVVSAAPGLWGMDLSGRRCREGRSFARRLKPVAVTRRRSIGWRRERMLASRPDGAALRGERRPQLVRPGPAEVQLPGAG